MEYLPTFALECGHFSPNVGKYSLHGASGLPNDLVTEICHVPLALCFLRLVKIPALKLIYCSPSQKRVGRLLSFWEGLFSGAMLVLGGVFESCFCFSSDGRNRRVHLVHEFLEPQPKYLIFSRCKAQTTNNIPACRHVQQETLLGHIGYLKVDFQHGTYKQCSKPWLLV